MKIKENVVEFKIDYLTLEIYPCDSKYNSMKFGVFQNDTEDITRLFCNNNNIDGNIITDVELDDIIHKCKEFSIIFMNNCRIGDGVSKQNIDNIIYKELGTNHKISYVNTSADGYIKYGYIECVLHEGKVKNEFFESMPDIHKCNFEEMYPKNFKLNPEVNIPPLAPMPFVSPEEFFQSSFGSVKNDSENSKNSSDF